MEAPRSRNHAMLDAATQATSAPIKAALAGLALALVLCLGAWGAHAADPQPDNPNTTLAATAVDEAVVAVVADHAIVQIDGQTVTGTGFKAPVGKPLTFSVYAEDGYEIDTVFVSDIEGNGVPIVGGLPTFTIDAEGVVDGLTIEASATASAKEDHPNAGLFLEKDDADDDASGEVIEATVAGKSATFTYDGEAHTVVFEVLDANGVALDGYFALAETPEFVDATDGVVEVPATNVTIFNAEGRDITSSFDFEVQPGSIEILPAQVTIVTPSASKVYDGTPLTADEMQLDIPGVEEFMDVAITIAATGSQTQVGQSANTYSIDWGTVNPANYKIDETLGTLIVSANEAPIVITLHDATHTYDGKPFTSTDFDLAAPSGYRAEITATGSQTDAGSSKNSVASYRILDAQGNDVTSTFSDISTVDGTLTVEPAELTIATPSASKPYDGKALTATAEGWIEGFVAGETATYAITGSRTDVGSSLNTYSLEWDGTAKEKNYKVIEDLGVLAITEAPAASSGGNAANGNASNGGTASNAGASAEPAPAAVETPAAPVAAAPVAAAPEATPVAAVATQVDTAEYESAPVSSTPNVVYLTPASTPASTDEGSATQSDDAAAQASSATSSDARPAAAATEPSSSARDADAKEDAKEDAEEAAEEEVVEEEVIADDATPLAGIDAPDQGLASTPWIILGVILLAAILVRAVLLLRSRRSDKNASA